MHTHDHQPVEAEHQRGRVARPERQADLPALAAGAATRPGVVSRESVLHLQRTAGNAGASALFEERSPVLDVVSSGGGRALDEPVRTEMEARLGHRFDDVRVHTDGAADASARAVNAHAYTVGSDVVFQRGRYDTASDEGRTLLAHELTHVVQQRSGPVEGSPAAGGIRVSDPGDRFEREAAANAERVTAAPAPVAAGGEGASAAVQRQAAPEEDEEPVAQGAFVQREAADEEEIEE